MRAGEDVSRLGDGYDRTCTHHTNPLSLGLILRMSRTHRASRKMLRYVKLEERRPAIRPFPGSRRRRLWLLMLVIVERGAIHLAFAPPLVLCIPSSLWRCCYRPHWFSERVAVIACARDTALGGVSHVVAGRGEDEFLSRRRGGVPPLSLLFDS